MTEPRWLALPQAAQYLDLSVDALRRLVRQGKLPQPDRTLGPRMPRWDRKALDSAMGTTTPSAKDPDSALEAWLEKQRNADREAHAS